jgi:hypothetical protein
VTLFLQVCGVLAVLSIPYAVITIADKAMQKKRNEARFAERKAQVMGDARRTRRAF